MSLEAAAAPTETTIGPDPDRPLDGASSLSEGLDNGDTLVAVTPSSADRVPQDAFGEPRAASPASVQPPGSARHRHVALPTGDNVPVVGAARDWDTQPLRLNVTDDVPEPSRSSVTAVRASFWYLGDVELLSQRFDARLLCLTPRAEEVHRRYFPREAEKFLSALLRPVEALAAATEGRSHADGADQLRRLGARLAQAGMRGQDFSYIGLSLVRAVRDSYTGQWNPTLGAAWSEIHQWIVSSLIQGAREAADSALPRELGTAGGSGQHGHAAG